jgi:hypothetical protein
MIETFTVEIETGLDVDKLKHQILKHFSIPLGKSDYKIESETASGFVFARKYRPYAAAAVLFFFLIFPLLLLLFERTDRILFSIAPLETGTRLVIVGDAPHAIRHEFAQLVNTLPNRPG